MNIQYPTSNAQHPNPGPGESVQKALCEIRGTGLERTLTEYPQVGGRITIDGREFLNFSSNDYLDLARHADLVSAAKAAVDEYGAGSTASRLVTGTLPCHTELEKKLADYKGYPAALVFSSGYMTNAGVISALLSRNDHLFVDRLAHASIVDAAILSRAKLHRFQHNDAHSLARIISSVQATGRKLIVTEAIFSMDGDIAPLVDIASVAEEHDAMLMVDEAHATGVMGPNGSGLVRELGLTDSVDISMGTLSKTLGSHGGYVACTTEMRDLMINRARSLIYTTAPAPAAMGAATAAVSLLAEGKIDGTVVMGRAAAFRAALQDAGLDTGESTTQIVPVIIGDIEKTLAASRSLRDCGILAVAIRPPTVPKNTARLRFSITLAHSQEDLERSATAVINSLNL